MNLSLLTVGASAAHGSQGDPGKATRRQLRERAVALAAHEGRAPQDASKADWEQAKRELLCPPGLGFNACPPAYQGVAGQAQTSGTPEWLL